jgi:hypothetical protein
VRTGGRGVWTPRPLPVGTYQHDVNDHCSDVIARLTSAFEVDALAVSRGNQVVHTGLQHTGLAARACRHADASLAVDARLSDPTMLQWANHGRLSDCAVDQRRRRAAGGPATVAGNSPWRPWGPDWLRAVPPGSMQDAGHGQSRGLALRRAASVACRLRYQFFSNARAGLVSSIRPPALTFLPAAVANLSPGFSHLLRGAYAECIDRAATGS